MRTGYWKSDNYILKEHEGLTKKKIYMVKSNKNQNIWSLFYWTRKFVLVLGEVYSVRSMYKWLERNIHGSHHRWIWKAKIPLKIQIFLWLLFHHAVLTRDNTRKKNWSGSPVCSFFDQLESARHFFFTCGVACVVWRLVGSLLQTNLVPNSTWQYFGWMH